MKIFVLLNPLSGGGRAKGQKLLIKKLFYQKGHDVELKEIANFEKDVTKYVSDYTKGGYDVFVVAGGDGTIRTVINEVIGKDINLLVLPLGTANVFTNEMGIGSNFRKAAALLETGVLKKFDVGKVKSLKEKSEAEQTIDAVKGNIGENFLLMAGIGFDAEVIKNLVEEWKPKLKQWAYILSGFMTALKYKYHTFDLEIEDENGTTVKENSFFTVISNSSYYGGPYPLAFDAKMYDGLFDLVIFKDKGFINVLKAFWALKKGKFNEYPGVRFMRAKRVKATPENINIISVQLDGDLWDNLPVEFWLEPAAVGMYIPKKKAAEMDNIELSPEEVQAEEEIEEDTEE